MNTWNIICKIPKYLCIIIFILLFQFFLKVQKYERNTSTIKYMCHFKKHIQCSGMFVVGIGWHETPGLFYHLWVNILVSCPQSNGMYKYIVWMMLTDLMWLSVRYNKVSHNCSLWLPGIPPSIVTVICKRRSGNYSYS